MSDAPTGTAERYLDALRALGVPDAAIRRHHDVDADAPLHAALAGELSAPTDRLLEVLAGTGAVLDLEAVAAEEGAQLAAALGRYGFAVECTPLGDDVEVVATDRLGDFVTHLRVPAEPEELRSALADRLLADAGLVAVPLVDGRTLLTGRGALAGLQARYGRRLEVFATPLLHVDAPSVDAPPAGPLAAGQRAPAAAGRADAPADAAGAPEQPAASTNGAERPTASADAAERPTASADAAEQPPAAADAADPDAVPAADSDAVAAADVDEVLAAADEETVAAIRDELEAGGPDVRAVDDTVDGSVDAAASSLGGGPRRTVSGSGIDEVFAEIESAADDGEAARRRSDDPFTTPMDEPDEADGLAGGGPERTVSETSADDILAEARGDADFESIAREQGADPEAVLDDADDLPDAVAAEGAEPADAAESADDGADATGEPASDGGIAWTREERLEDGSGVSERVRSILWD